MGNSLKGGSFWHRYKACCAAGCSTDPFLCCAPRTSWLPLVGGLRAGYSPDAGGGSFAQGVASIRQRLKLLKSVVKACCQTIDEAAGTSFAAEEQQIEQDARRAMQQSLDSDPGDVRGAALAGALVAWQTRVSGLLPRMHYVVASAQMQTSGQPASSGSAGPGSAAVPLLALQRDVAVSAVGCCAATGCSSSESVWAWQRPAYLCAGCQVARYCRCEARVSPLMGLWRTC